MLSKSEQKLIKSLHTKKGRKNSGLFLVEGRKSVQEALKSSYVVRKVLYVDASNDFLPSTESVLVDAALLNSLSALKDSSDCMALVEMPKSNTSISQSKWSLVLDKVQDPGNLGTIIRTAEWFGISRIICISGTVDSYNPKVVQASMGALFNTSVNYLTVDSLKRILKADDIVVGAMLEGDNIYSTSVFSPNNSGYIVMGNEGNGITEEVRALLTHSLTIPRIGKSESLNVAIATSIFCTVLYQKMIDKK